MTSPSGNLRRWVSTGTPSEKAFHTCHSWELKELCTRCVTRPRKSSCKLVLGSPDLPHAPLALLILLCLPFTEINHSSEFNSILSPMNSTEPLNLGVALGVPNITSLPVPQPHKLLASFQTRGVLQTRNQPNWSFQSQIIKLPDFSGNSIADLHTTWNFCIQTSHHIEIPPFFVFYYLIGHFSD